MSQATSGHSTAGAVPSAPSRRSLIGAGASLLLGATVATAAHGAPVTTPPAGDDAEIIRLVAEIMANHVETNRLSEEEDRIPNLRERGRFNKAHIRPLVVKWHEMRDDLVMLRAATPEGFRAKALVVQTFSNCSPGYAQPWDDDAMAWSLANDMLGVASVWRVDEDDAGDVA